MTPLFLTLDEVFAIHANQIEHYGGEPGLRGDSVPSATLPPRTWISQLKRPLPQMFSTQLCPPR